MKNFNLMRYKLNHYLKEETVNIKRNRNLILLAITYLTILFFS